MAGLEWILYRDHFAGKVDSLIVVPGAVRGKETKRELLTRLSHPAQNGPPLLGIRLAPSNPSQGASPMLGIRSNSNSGSQPPLVVVQEVPATPKSEESIKPLETDAPKMEGPRMT